jgi:predicted glycosyltransferase
MARFMFYSHDSFGLGHLRRTLALASAVSELDPTSNSLIVTGSTVASSYRLPPRVDTVKLPTVTKNGGGRYEALRLGTGFRAVRTLRMDVARAAAEAFQPDVAVIDKSPLGLKGELQPTLDLLRDRTDCRLVLGLRDIEDSPAKLRSEWCGAGLQRAIQHYYDQVLIYGPSTTNDALRSLGWEHLGLPVERIGYVVRRIPDQAPPGLPGEYVLVTVGGGADGFRIVATFLEAVRLAPLSCPAVIVTGPLMRDAEARRIDELGAGLAVRVEDFRADMEGVIAGARAVVSMAGYNTVAELMEARKPCLLIPRVTPREEQLVRARALASAGLADILHPDALDPPTMRSALDALLSRPPPEPEDDWDGGATRAAEILIGLANGSPVGYPIARAEVPRRVGRPRSKAERVRERARTAAGG